MGLAEVVSGHKPRQVTVRLCPDVQLADELAQARQTLQEFRKASSTLDETAIQEALQKVEDLQATVDEVTVEFVLQGIPRAKWRTLQDQHQPSKKQREQFLQQGVILDHDPDTFPPAAIAASLVSPVEDTPEATLQQIQKLWDEWHYGEAERLWRACLEANLGVASVPKRSTGSVTTSRSETKSEPLTNSESPGQSFSDVGSLAG